MVVTTRNSWIESKVLRSTLVNGMRPFWSFTSTPSSVTFDWSLRAPFTVPFRMSPVFLESRGSALRNVTPAWSESNPAGLRAFSGSCWIGIVPKAFPTEASVVFSCAAEAETVTVSSTASTVPNTTGSVTLVLTSSETPSIITGAKPSRTADSVYDPGGNWANV